MPSEKPAPTSVRTVTSPWLTEKEAAEYCRCSLWAFRAMHLPAKNSGGRKVYHRDLLDASIQARPWQRTAASPEFRASTSVSTAGKSDILLKLQNAKRLRPYKPRKKQSSSE